MPRRRPTQERSQRKFDALLQASRELLSDVGFESFTCEEVASRAELPIGTLYQFFANKYVIVFGKGGNLWATSVSGGIYVGRKISSSGRDGLPQIAMFGVDSVVTFARDGSGAGAYRTSGYL